ncbi:TPA: PIN domain-containing protein [Pseudomonas aeruginosa]|uniref:PIN domain-containing protein n=1 Tax=Pseudomonas aeruginosa TaxID=287 RepID=UPI0013CE2AFC|nr:PIN domain-containing protein [Pseudomonas aeruginosa]
MSSKKTVVFAPDTNFFIQCKDAVEIEWSRVSNADKVLLVVLNEVHRELDRLKSGGNTRRARRAKAVSSQLRDLIVSDQEEVELRPSDPAVSLRLAPRLDPHRAKPDGYDAASADERIAEEAKACSEEHFDGNLILLSHDGMPLRAAKLMGVQICPIPEAWLLPPEPSDQDRVIQKLSERVAALERQAPVIVLRLEAPNETLISGKVTFYPPLENAFINGVMEAIRNEFPVRPPNGGSRPFDNIFRGLEPARSESEMREHESKYNEWLKEVEDVLTRLPCCHNLANEGIEAHLVLSNSGSTPAEHLVVDVSTAGRIRLKEPVEDEDEGEDEIPTIPQPPKVRRLMMFEGLIGSTRPLYQDPLRNFHFATPRPSRDRHEFYWEFDEPESHTKHCRGECEDFRHGLKDERIRLIVRWESPSEHPITAAIKVVISARNLPAPIEKTIPVRLDVEVGDSGDLIRSIILEDLGVSI